MKFVVTKNAFGNEVDVKLHWETKEKLKKAAFRTLVAATIVVSVVSIYNDKKDKPED